MKPVRGLLVGRHALHRAFLLAWMDRFDAIRIVAEAAGAREALEQVQRHKPDLVLIEFEALQSDNTEMLMRLRAEHPKVRVIIYFAYTHDQIAARVIQAGASGFVIKSASSEEMENAIRTVVGGGVYLSPEFLRSLGTGVVKEGVPDKEGKVLSPRQAEILKLVAVGLSTKAIAFELKINAKTVDVHKQLIKKRLGEASNTALVRYAIRTGLVPLKQVNVPVSLPQHESGTSV